MKIGRPSKRASTPQRVCFDFGSHATSGHDRRKQFASTLGTKALIEGAKVDELLRTARSATVAYRDEAATRCCSGRRGALRAEFNLVKRAIGLTFSQALGDERELDPNGLRVSVVYASHILRRKLVPRPRRWSSLIGLVSKGTEGEVEQQTFPHIKWYDSLYRKGKAFRAKLKVKFDDGDNVPPRPQA